MADWIPATEKPQVNRLSGCSPFVLCALQPQIGPSFHVIGYYDARRREWRNNYGLIDGYAGQHVTHWQQLPALP